MKTISLLDSAMMQEKNTAVKAYPLQIMPDGKAIFPQEFLGQLNLNVSHSLFLLQIGDLGVLLSTPPQIMELTQRFSNVMEKEGVSLESLLEGLQEERIAMWEEHQTHG